MDVADNWSHCDSNADLNGGRRDVKRGGDDVHKSGKLPGPEDGAASDEEEGPWALETCDAAAGDSLARTWLAGWRGGPERSPSRA